MNQRHLARMVGLSPSAISLALRDSPKVSPEMRARIREVAAAQGYKPDAGMVEMMTRLRKSRLSHRADFAVVSLYDTPRPWESWPHFQLIYSGMKARAVELGYGLKPFWLRAKGMTFERLRSVLDARGIQGLISFGAPQLEAEFPANFDRCAIVNLGLSIRTPLHRITSHFYNDTVRVLEEVCRRGYERPGLVLGNYEHERAGHAHVAAYLAWCEHTLGLGRVLPVRHLQDVEEEPLLDWVTSQRPDVVIFVHRSDQLPKFQSFLKRNCAMFPPDMGVAVLSELIGETGFCGIQQNQALMGAWAVEHLAARIANRDFGIPAHPHIEMVEGRWVEGESLRNVPRLAAS